ncbi:MAG: flavin reductase family protein [Chakrabartia sp.]
MNDFRQGMRQLAGAVTVITTGRGEDVAGLTATAVCSLTAEPPRLLACLNAGGGSFDLLRRHNRFCVNLIGAPDLAIAQIFAGMGPDKTADKFASGHWVRAEDRAPRLASALVSFECAVHSLTLLSTHGLAIGDVLDVHLADPSPAPLLYHDGRFAELAAS